MPEPRVTREVLQKAAELADGRAKKARELLETRTPSEMTDAETKDHIQNTNQFMFNGVGGADYHAIKNLADESAKSVVQENVEALTEVVELWARATNAESTVAGSEAAGRAISEMLDLIRTLVTVEFFAGLVVGIHIAEVIQEEDKENA